MSILRNQFTNYLIWRFILRNPSLRQRIQRVLFRTGEVKISLLGQDMVVDAQEEIGYLRASRTQYSNILFRDEIPQLLTVMSLLRPGCTFVDAGANVGFWSLTAATLAVTNPGLEVLSFEANPSTYARLTKNVENFPNVTARCVALSDKAEDLTFYTGATSGVFGTFKSLFSSSNTVTIHAEPLDGFIKERRDLVVKIDVEGHELPVLRGMKAALDSGRVRVVFIDGYQDHAEREILELLRDFRLIHARSCASFEPGQGHNPLLAVRMAPAADKP